MTYNSSISEITSPKSTDSINNKDSSTKDTNNNTTNDDLKSDNEIDGMVTLNDINNINEITEGNMDTETGGESVM